MSIDNIWNKLRDLNSDGVLDSLLYLGGKLIWVDGYNGNDTNDGTKNRPVKTIDGTKGAYARARDGKHDIIVIKSTGATAALSTVRLDAAYTQSKSNVHMVAQSPATPLFSPRARIAPTATTTAFANFFTLSGSGCYFHNIQFWHGFNTGTTSAIALTITGDRNHFNRCHIVGMGDAASGADAGSRCVKISDGDENFFENCVIGVDTVDRSAANASVEFASGAARNVFKGCIFPIRATATSVLLVKVAAAAGSDRFQLFDECVVWNHGTSTIAGLCTLAASMGGYLLFNKGTIVRSITGFGTDATSRGQIYITGPTDGSTVSGVGYNPNA